MTHTVRCSVFRGYKHTVIIKKPESNPPQHLFRLFTTTILLDIYIHTSFKVKLFFSVSFIFTLEHSGGNVFVMLWELSALITPHLSQSSAHTCQTCCYTPALFFPTVLRETPPRAIGLAICSNRRLFPFKCKKVANHQTSVHERLANTSSGGGVCRKTGME